LSDLSPAPLGGPPSTSSTSVVAAAGPAASTPRGPTIDIFNFGGGRCRTCRQHPQGATINVSNFGGGRCQTCCEHPPGANHRRLQLRWWPLPDLLPAPLRGSVIDVSNFGGGHCRTSCQHPLGGPPLTSSTSMVTAVGPATSTPRGPAIDVFNFDGGRCRTCRQHPQGLRHRRLQIRWWSLPNLPPAPPGGRHRRFTEPGTGHHNFSSDIYQGGHRYKQGTFQKMEVRVSAKNFRVLAVLRTREL
jgi:hypothetical protein